MATYLTQAGLEKLQEELKRLREQKRKLSQEVGTAREWGDLRENSEYHAAKERLQQVLSKIGDLEFKLAHVHLVDPTQHEKGVATVGTQVTVKDLTANQQEVYTLVGSDESDPASGKISIQSPLGKAFLGRRVKEKVTVNLPAGPCPYQILSVEPAQ